MSSLVIILRPSLTLNAWKVQVDGLRDEQMKKLTKKLGNVKCKREHMTGKFTSIQWRINPNESVLPIIHIAPLVNLFESWGYKLFSCEKGVHFNCDLIFWTLVWEEEEKKAQKSYPLVH